jgi:hypothetical protein
MAIIAQYFSYNIFYKLQIVYCIQNESFHEYEI